MNKHLILLSLLGAQLLQAGQAVVPGDERYFTKKSSSTDVEMIYTEQNQYAAKEAMQLEPIIHKEYESTFGYRLDQTLYVGIISQQNQIANGFSTQYPLNMQINYIGGSQMVDYFTTASWLDTLIYHETAHNYQMNAKASAVSRGLHTVFGNNVLPLFPLPLFVLPNSMLTSYTLEGNAVLNESWHGNGGRLYSGRLRAESILQAKAGHITPHFLFNQTTHEFPYYDRHYIVGGFFQLYLAEKYGLEKTNSFFYNHSKSWLWPFRTNTIYRMTFGESFEEAIQGYEAWLLAQGEGFVEAEGERIATSMNFTSLNNNCDKIFFLTSDAQHAPELVKLFKSDKTVTKERDSYLQAKILNIHDEYATQGSNHVNPTRITQGLFDDDGKLIEGTDGKMVQGYLKDGVPVYFDVPSSFLQPQLYVGDEFYAKVNSSVFIDSDDNLYYFVQEGKKRTLFKNKQALYALDDYYGIVSDVDSKGRVYFVANSEKGTSLYRYDDGDVTRVSSADNVIEARLVNDEEVLIAAIGEENYYYVINPITPTQEVPHNTKLFFEDKPYFANASFISDSASDSFLSESDAAAKEVIDTEDAYYEPLNLHYAGASATAGALSNNGENLFTYSVNANFQDPLLTNSLSVFAQQGADRKGVVGASYSNNAHLLTFGASAYGVYADGDPKTYRDYNVTSNTYGHENNISRDTRKYGYSAVLGLPVIQSGYNSAGLSLNYYQDYDDNQRSPLVATASVQHTEFYGQAVDYDYVNALAAFAAVDRGDKSGGFNYVLSHGLPWKMFAGMGLQYVRTDYYRGSPNASSAKDVTRGVKFSNFQNALFVDPATVVMPSLEFTRYVKQAGIAQAKFTKQFDGRILFFTFPVSLTREVVYGKYRYYDIQDFGQKDYSKSVRDGHTVYNESTAGVSLEFLFMNSMTIPLSFEYIHNDNTLETDNYRLLLGAGF